jgi:DNA-binding MarR family transcriptional regulator
MGDHDQPLWRRAATHTLHTSLMLKAVLEQRLQEETGMVLADNEALLNLGHSPEPLRMSDIAQRLILSPGGTTKVIDRLEEMGCVERSPDPEDRRATLVALTDAGRDAIDRNRAVIDAELKEIWAGHVTEEEAEVIVTVMDRVIHAHHGHD